MCSHSYMSTTTLTKSDLLSRGWSARGIARWLTPLPPPKPPAPITVAQLWAEMGEETKEEFQEEWTEYLHPVLGHTKVGNWGTRVENLWSRVVQGSEGEGDRRAVEDARWTRVQAALDALLAHAKAQGHLQPASAKSYVLEEVERLERSSEYRRWLRADSDKHAILYWVPRCTVIPGPIEPFQRPKAKEAKKGGKAQQDHVCAPATGSRYPHGQEIAWFHQKGESDCGVSANPLLFSTRGTAPSNPYEDILPSIGRYRYVRSILAELSSQDQIVLQLYYSPGKRNPPHYLSSYFGELLPLVERLFVDNLSDLDRRAAKVMGSKASEEDRLTLLEALTAAEELVGKAHDAYAAVRKAQSK